MYIVSTLQAARVTCMLLQLLTATVEAAKYKLAISLNILAIVTLIHQRVALRC